MPMIDAFNTDTFGTVSLTNSINKLPFKPSRIGQLGLFQSKPIPTTTAVIEEKAGHLALLDTKRRGEPATVGKAIKRTTRSFVVPHIPHEDTITAESIQNIRSFGSETDLQTVAQMVNERMTEMKQSHEATLEFHRLGALKGIVLDADGSTALFNYFTEYSVSQTTVEMALATATTNVHAKLMEVKRAIEDALGLDRGTYSHIHGLVGSEFWDAFTGHANVKTAYERWRDGEFLRADLRMGFEFGATGVLLEEYRGTVSGVAFLDPNEAYFFPVGVPNLFTTYFAPADFMETVNTMGKPLYAKQAPDPSGLNRFVTLHTQQNPLCMCHRPGVLIKAFQDTEAAASASV